MSTILWFGSKKEFERWSYDMLYLNNIQFKLCTNIHQTRGIEFHGYIIHYSAPKELRKEVNENFELFEHLINKRR